MLWTTLRRRDEGRRFTPRVQLPPRPLYAGFEFVAVIAPSQRQRRSSPSANPSLDQATSLCIAMNPKETSVNRTRPIFNNGEQVEQPGTSSMEPSVPIFSSTPGDEIEEFVNRLFKTDEWDSTLCNGPCLSGKCHMVQFSSSFSDDSIPWNDICLSPVAPERDHGSSPPMVSPVSTYSCPTMPLSPEDVEAQNAMEGAESAIDNNRGNCISVSNPENSVLPAALSKPGCSRTCTGCHDAHRLTASEVASKQKFFKGVKEKKNSDKWTCEIRISKKLPKDSKLKVKGKLWLGTFDTRCQAARALHVGRFLLSEKKKNSATDALSFEQSSKTIQDLSEFKDRMRAKPLDAELLGGVKELAIAYDG